MRACAVKPISIQKNELIPEFDLDNLPCLERLADSYAQQRVRLAQTEEGMRFLSADQREISVFELSANVMWPIALVAKIDNQLRRHCWQIEIRGSHHFQDCGTDEP